MNHAEWVPRVGVLFIETIMNKGELVDNVASRTGLSRARAHAVIKALFDPAGGLIAEELRGGGSVDLPGFGSFTTRARAPRAGRDPRTGRRIEIAARRACVFRPRKGLRSSMKDMVGA